MLLKIPENRKAIIEYLNEIGEDGFIEDFVLPYFASYGYQVYRINEHGPGEHGKDIIFSRFIAFFLDTEYIAVQVKAEPARTSNVALFAHQIVRALRTSFPSRSGQGNLRPNQAIFINARRHTNDANNEFPELINGDAQFVRILSQENVCDLILNSGIGPKELIATLSISDKEAMGAEDKSVYDVLMGTDPKAIDHLLDYQLKLIQQYISPRLQEMIIDAIYARWQQDRSWDGTVKPMKWLDNYFDFLKEGQYKYLLDVINEGTSTTLSFAAEQYTLSIIRKIKPKMLASLANEFIPFSTKLATSFGWRNQELIFEKLKELSESDLVTDPSLKDLMQKTLTLLELRKVDYEAYKKLKAELDQQLYPEMYR